MIELYITGEVSGVAAKSLRSGLLGQTTVFLCPGGNCILIGGGTLEKFGVFCDGFLPTSPCDLPSCKLESDVSAGTTQGFSNNPNFLGCEGSCQRWFHAFCLGFDYKKYVTLSQRDYWQCNRYDCKVKSTKNK